MCKTCKSTTYVITESEVGKSTCLFINYVL